MTKKGQKGKYHKPKPRIAVYAGAAGSAGLATGAIHGAVTNDLTIPGQRLSRAAANLEDVVLNQNNAGVKTAAPLVIGVAASVVADKVGLNKALAKARMPFRI